MAVVASGTTSVGRVLVPGVAIIANQTHTIYFPDLDLNFVGLIGGIAIAQVDTPVPGVYRQEQFQELWTYSERYVPLNQSNRVFVFYFKSGGLRWEIHR